MVRVDQTTLKYHRSEDKESAFKPELDAKHGFQRQWNLKKLLSSHENAHITFTLIVQAVMGAFLWLFTGLSSSFFIEQDSYSIFAALQLLNSSSVNLATLILLLVLLSIGLFKLNMHLGKPHRFYRGFYNLRHSPVSREIAGVSLFFAGLMGFTVFSYFDHSFFTGLQFVFGLIAASGLSIGGYFMYKLYRIEARPFWNHINTATSFIATTLVLGSLAIVLVYGLTDNLTDQMKQLFLIIITSGLLIEIIGLWLHKKDLQTAKSEGAASFYEQTTTYGYSYWLRNALLISALLISLFMLVSHHYSINIFILLTLFSLSAAIIGRALFYVLVIPTTMPGAFFWKNKGFVEHARETGLADMPQLGVVYEKHHAFKVDELLETIQSTSLKDKFDQFKRIFTG